MEDLAQTASVDSGLVGNTEYFYQVVVLTEWGEEVESEVKSGKIHALVQSWPLEMDEGDYVRLYQEGDGITALVAGKQRVRLLIFDPQGTLAEEQTLLDLISGNATDFVGVDPPSVATALSPEGRRYLSMSFLRSAALNPAFMDSLKLSVLAPMAGRCCRNTRSLRTS
ncbi:MAG: hypothetical protein HYW07_23435 [Candidatus Latescibacteria bacterium]|nr:hypothetical protein [Candidatus Latescibacterota bacterium]